MPSMVRAREFRLPNIAATSNEAAIIIRIKFLFVVCSFEIWDDDIIFSLECSIKTKKAYCKEKLIVLSI